MSTLCPFCGAYSPRSCEMEDELGGAECPWLESQEDEPDADYLRETRDEMNRMWPETDDGLGDYLYDRKGDR